MTMEGGKREEGKSVCVGKEREREEHECKEERVHLFTEGEKSGRDVNTRSVNGRSIMK